MLSNGMLTFYDGVPHTHTGDGGAAAAAAAEGTAAAAGALTYTARQALLEATGGNLRAASGAVRAATLRVLAHFPDEEDGAVYDGTSLHAAHSLAAWLDIEQVRLQVVLCVGVCVLRVCLVGVTCRCFHAQLCRSSKKENRAVNSRVHFCTHTHTRLYFFPLLPRTD